MRLNKRVSERCSCSCKKKKRSEKKVGNSGIDAGIDIIHADILPEITEKNKKHPKNILLFYKKWVSILYMNHILSTSALAVSMAVIPAVSAQTTHQTSEPMMESDALKSVMVNRIPMDMLSAEEISPQRGENSSVKNPDMLPPSSSHSSICQRQVVGAIQNARDAVFAHLGKGSDGKYQFTVCEYGKIVMQVLASPGKPQKGR